MTSLVFAFMLAQAPAQAEVKPATLEGVVLHAASQTPIKKAKVTLTAIGAREDASSAETGDDGKFTLKDIKPGRYRLSADKTGYQGTGYGAKLPGEPVGQVLRIDAAAELTGMNIALPKQGVIAGKIVDSDGEPVAKALVIAMNNVYVNGKRTRLPAGTLPVMSNDLGEYRIGQLPPGKFIVCAIPEAMYQPTPVTTETKSAATDNSVTTCFPNIPQMAMASELEIKDASEVPGIDVRLIKTRTVTIKGKIDGIPASAGAVTILNLTPKDAGPMGRATGVRSMLQGSESKFEFKNVPPGSYILQTLPTGLGNVPYVVKAPLEVGDQPIEGLTIAAVTPFEVKGKVTAEVTPELKMGSIRVVLTPTDDIMTTFSVGTAGESGDFALPNIVGGRYRVAVGGMPPTHYVAEIRLGEQLVAGDEVDVPSAAAPIAVKLAVGQGSVTGLARNEKGEPMAGASIALIPEPRRPFRLKATRTDQTGLFRLPNVAPGEYLMLAFERVEQGSLEDDEFLKPLLGKARRVKVAESGSQAVDLSVLPASR